jgi:hypothetical protein
MVSDDASPSNARIPSMASSPAANLAADVCSRLADCDISADPDTPPLPASLVQARAVWIRSITRHRLPAHPPRDSLAVLIGPFDVFSSLCEELAPRITSPAGNTHAFLSFDGARLFAGHFNLRFAPTLATPHCRKNQCSTPMSVQLPSQEGEIKGT